MPPVAALADRANTAFPDQRPVVLWLWAVAALVFCMIVVGGATRLTQSGLSITEWQPIIGALPPLSEANWQTAFAKYKQIPQYTRLNLGMSLADFKAIYWWEWAHRFLGRLIGIVFALPLAWFWWRGRLRPGVGGQLALILGLGGLQGGIGWYMVKSGLVDRVDVSQYRLALHLTVAFLLLGLLIWTALTLGAPARRTLSQQPSPHRTAAWVVLGLVLLQVVAGAFVAGMKAGLAYNTWPLMDGRLGPSGLGAMAPWWINAFENAATVQFDHRLIAYLLLAAVIWHAAALRNGPHARSALLLAIAIVLQAALGIHTLLAHVPLGLGLLHQAGAAIVFGLAVWHAHRLTQPAAATH